MFAATKSLLLGTGLTWTDGMVKLKLGVHMLIKLNILFWM